MAHKIVLAKISAGMVFAYKQKERLGILVPEKDIIWIFCKKNPAFFFRHWEFGERVWIKFVEQSRTNQIVTALMPQSMCPDPDLLGGDDEVEISLDLPKIIHSKDSWLENCG